MAQGADSSSHHRRRAAIRAWREVRLLLVCLLAVRDAAARDNLRRPALAAALRSIEAGHCDDAREARQFLRRCLSSTREVCTLSERYRSQARISGNEAAAVLRVGSRAEHLLEEALQEAA